MEAVREHNRDAYGYLLKCKPERCNKRKVRIYSSLIGYEERIAKRAIQGASRPMFGQALEVKFLKFPEESPQSPGITPEMPMPDPLQMHEAERANPDMFPMTAKVVGHYPNNHLLLTTLGNVKTKDARAFRMGMEIPVFKEGEWLVVRGLPKTATKYR